MSEAEEEIIIEEEDVTKEPAVEGEEKLTTEELKVKGEELVETVKEVVREAGVRRVVIKSNKGRVLLEFPLILGVPVILLLPYWSALALIAALVTDCSIVVERGEKDVAEE